MFMIKDATNQCGYIGRCAALSVYNTVFSTTVVHGFLLERGVNYYELGLLGTANSAGQIFCLLLCAGLCDRFQGFRSFRRALALLLLILSAQGIATALLFGARPVLVGASLFYAYLGISALFSALYCFFGMLDIGTIVRITPDSAHVMRLTGLAGIAGGLASILTGFVVTRAGGDMTRLAVVAACATLVGACLTMTHREARVRSETGVGLSGSTPLKTLKCVFSLPSFRAMIPSNVLRGVQFACVYYMASFGIMRFSASHAIAGTLAFAASCAPFLSYLLLTVLGKRIGEGGLYFLGCALSAVGMLALMLLRAEPVFAAAYFLLYVGQGLIDVGYPLGMYCVAPPEMLGQFSAIRILLYTLVSSACIYCLGVLSSSVGEWPVFLLGVIAMLSGGCHFFKIVNRAGRV